MICAALGTGVSSLRGALDSEDTQVMVAALRTLGVDVRASDGGRNLEITGCSGAFPAASAELFVGNSGTTIRFLTAAATLGRGEVRLDGVARMRQRPIGDLVDALRQLGGRVEYEGEAGFPPLSVSGGGLQGGDATVRGDVSSQFLSGLLMAAPYALRRVKIAVEGVLVSQPYVDMTLEVMRAFAAQVEVEVEVDEEYRAIKVDDSHRYIGRRYAIEPDASAASYFFAAAAVTGGEVTVEGLHRQSLQGDVGFCYCLEKMGCEVVWQDNAITVRGRTLHGVDVDMNAISDTVQTLAVVALAAKGTTRIRNVAHIQHKETDRLTATASELRKLGATVEQTDDGLAIRPGLLR
ncbi:MAG: 3-phosphoshikimate 1-carboxyvinyltransferase, partial [Planctomycetota bacterium]